MTKFTALIFISLFFFSHQGARAQTPVNSGHQPVGTLKHPIIDSRMTKKEAFDGLDPNCPKEIRKRQRLIKLKYYSFDRQVHQGQMVLDKDLVKDIKSVFKLILSERFPITSVIPISDVRF